MIKVGIDCVIYLSLILDNAAPIELDAKNSHNEKQIEAVDFDKDIELKAQPDDYEKG
jgi:hypothetical protein